MLKAKLFDANGRKMLLIGLEPENIRRLQDGKPILFDAAEFGIDAQVAIITGPSIEAMIEMIEAVTVPAPGTGQGEN